MPVSATSITGKVGLFIRVDDLGIAHALNSKYEIVACAKDIVSFFVLRKCPCIF